MVTETVLISMLFLLLKDIGGNLRHLAAWLLPPDGATFLPRLQPKAVSLSNSRVFF